MNSKQDKISTMSEIKDFKEFPTRDDYFANVISENLPKIFSKTPKILFKINELFQISKLLIVKIVALS